MPIRPYDTRAWYDADYEVWLPGRRVPLPATTLDLVEQTLVDVDGAWTRPLAGGRLSISLGREHRLTLNRSEVPIVSAVGSTYVVDSPRAWPATTVAAAAGAVTYVIPPILMRYDGPVLFGTEKNVVTHVAPLMVALGITPADRTLMVGAGMGFEVAAARQLGYSNTWGTETSPYIEAAFGDTASEEAELRQRLLNVDMNPDAGEGAALLASWLASSVRTQPNLMIFEDITQPGGRARTRQRMGGDPDQVVTLNVLPNLFDAEAQSLAAAARQMAPVVAHRVLVLDEAAPNADNDDLNWKSAAAWKALLAPDLIVSNSGAVT